MRIHICNQAFTNFLKTPKRDRDFFINILTNPMVSLLEYIFLKSVKFVLADNIKKKSSEEIKLCLLFKQISIITRST